MSKAVIRVATMFDYVDFKFYLKEVGTKINLHTWKISISHNPHGHERALKEEEGK